MRITINGNYFQFSAEALNALNEVLNRNDVTPLTSDYKNGKYVYTPNPDGSRKIIAVTSTEWE
jgi:hypothetical protein